MMNEQLINNGMIIDTDQKNQEIDSCPRQSQESINYINNLLDIINDVVDQKDKEIGSESFPPQSELIIEHFDDVIDDLEFSFFDHRQELFLQQIFFTQQFVIRQKELQYWLSQADVKECTIHTVIDDEIREIRDIKCVIKDIITMIIEVYYPLLHQMHLFRNPIYLNEANEQRQMTEQFFGVVEEHKENFQDWSDYLNKPYDRFETTRKVFRIFILDIWEELVYYYRDTEKQLEIGYYSEYSTDDNSDAYSLHTCSTHESEQKYETLSFSSRKYDVNCTIFDLYNNEIQDKISTLTGGDRFIINIKEMTAFGETNPGKKFKKCKKKLKLGQFEFKIYLTPNGYTHKKNHDHFVQFAIIFNGFPSDIHSVVTYFKLYEKQTKTEFQCTKIFKYDSLNYVTWCRTSLPWKKFEKYKQLEFGYEIEILQINTINNEIIYHSISPGESFWGFYETWYIEKYMFSALKFENYLTLFYSEMWKDSFCVSCGSMGKKSPTINISIHVFKLPPKVVQMECVFAIGAEWKKPSIHYVKEHIFSYNSTDLIIQVNKRESDMIRSCAIKNKNSIDSKYLYFECKLTIAKIWIEGYMNYPYELNPDDEIKAKERDKIRFEQKYETQNSKMKDAAGLDQSYENEEKCQHMLTKIYATTKTSHKIHVAIADALKAHPQSINYQLFTKTALYICVNCSLNLLAITDNLDTILKWFVKYKKYYYKKIKQPPLNVLNDLLNIAAISTHTLQALNHVKTVEFFMANETRFKRMFMILHSFADFWIQSVYEFQNSEFIKMAKLILDDYYSSFLQKIKLFKNKHVKWYLELGENGEYFMKYGVNVTNCKVLQYDYEYKYSMYPIFGKLLLQKCCEFPELVCRNLKINLNSREYMRISMQNEKICTMFSKRRMKQKRNLCFYFHYRKWLCNNVKCNVSYFEHMYGYKYQELLDKTNKYGVVDKKYKKNKKWYLCKGCCLVSYCCRKCQKYDWKNGHRNICDRVSDK